jgi:hypothetical protein
LSCGTVISARTLQTIRPARRRALRAYQASLPFAVVADPHRLQCDEFGVQARLRASTHPRASRSAMRGYADAIDHRSDRRVHRTTSDAPTSA